MVSDLTQSPSPPPQPSTQDEVEMEFFLDPSRCIGCQACAECDTHKGHAMIHLEYVDRPTGVQTTPVVCMHCEDPTCAKVCPADAIKQDDEGKVHTAAKPRCVAYSNCVLACPFGVPKMHQKVDLMMKCDMCYDRTSVGKKPMCATVCPSGALYYGPRAYVDQYRRESPTRDFQFGAQSVRTKVHMMTSPDVKALPFDVLEFLPWEGREDEEANLIDAMLASSRPGAPDAAGAAVWDNQLFSDPLPSEPPVPCHD